MRIAQIGRNIAYTFGPFIIGMSILIPIGNYLDYNDTYRSLDDIAKHEGAGMAENEAWHISQQHAPFPMNLTEIGDKKAAESWLEQHSSN